MPYILNVAIGILFVYLLFSLIVSAANEVIQSILDKRKQYLWAGIDELLQDRDSRLPTGEITGPAKQFSNHPLIAALSKGADGLPSYIPAKLFSTTLIDLIKSGALGNGTGSEIFQKAKEMKDLIGEIKNEKLQRALTALWREASDDLEAFGTNIEHWFDSAMDRVSGWYKRYTQYWLLGLAMLLAILCNVDSIHILQVLSTDPKARDSLVEGATHYLHSDKPGPEASPGATPTMTGDLGSLRTQMQELEALSLPIGWNGPQCDYFSRQWLFVIVGWLLTAFAGSLGAPFWFDTLNRVMNVRAAGKVPDASKGTATAKSSNPS
jgi:hypothetical protein